jgi:four helix bundle protein
VTLNIAEGAGEFSKKEKARFYRMARRSATECAAVLDVSSTLAFITPDQHSPGREILLRVVSMLVKLIVSFDPSGKGTGMGMGTDEA